MFVGTQGLHAAFVLVVPDPQGLVVGTAHYEPPSGMDQDPAHPVVMSHLRRHEPLLPDSDAVNVWAESSTHQSHKADASADVPHLDRFISGAREKEGPGFSTLLALEKRKAQGW